MTSNPGPLVVSVGIRCFMKPLESEELESIGYLALSAVIDLI